MLADLVLTVKTSSKELLSRLAKLMDWKSWSVKYIQATIDEMSTTNNDAINRDDLKEIDESGVMVPEPEYEAGEWVVPLIQAGSWLEGALVSNAIKTELSLTLPTSFSSSRRCDYLKYGQREGREKADDQVVAPESTLAVQRSCK